MIGLAGCGENKNSREWIENKVSEVSRVYPTENLFDLFKQFPEGFEIEQVYFKEKSDGLDDFITEIKLKGDATSRTITGTLAKIPAKDDTPKSEEEVVSVQYVDNKFRELYTSLHHQQHIVFMRISKKAASKRKSSFNNV